MRFPYAAVLLAIAASAMLVAMQRPTRAAHAPERYLLQKDVPEWTPYGVPGSPVKALSRRAVARVPALGDYLRALVAKSNKYVIRKVEKPIYLISSDTLAKLFPKWTFYVVPYQEEKNPDAKQSVNIAHGLYYVVGVNDLGEHVDFFGYNNHDEFGRFLASHKIRLRNADEGRQIWIAYCHLIRRGSPQLDPRKEGPTLWHLGVHLSGDREYYFEVHTNEDGAVLSGRLQSRLVVPKKPGK